MTSIKWDKRMIETGAIEQFEQGQYQGAIQLAFVVLEERIRQKGEFESDDFGSVLMKNAFNPTSGEFSIGETKAEKEGIMFLYAGAIQAFRNPMSHRFLEDINEQKSMEILQFINLLLRLIEENTEGGAERINGEPTYRGQTLSDILQEGEGETIEFKQQLPDHARTIAKETASLANTKGGVLLIGVSDDGQVVGLQNAKAVEERVSNVIRESLNPTPYPQIEIQEVENNKIVILNVQERESNPFDLDGQYYGRVGSTLHNLTFEDLKERFL